MNYLELTDVSMQFGGLLALSDISFSVNEGEILGIMGANGAGKTTLFSVIAGHVRLTGGDIRLRGQSLVGLRPDQICRHGIVRTFQIVKPFRNLTVLENLMTAAMFGPRLLRKRPEVVDYCTGILSELGLGSWADTPAHALTLSWQKKLELARAIASGCPIIMLDEVMAGLTPPEVMEMLGIVRQLHQSRGLTILIVEHVMHALMKLSSRVIVLHHGELIAIGTPQEIAVNPRVLEVYFGQPT